MKLKHQQKSVLLEMDSDNLRGQKHVRAMLAVVSVRSSWLSGYTYLRHSCRCQIALPSTLAQTHFSSAGLAPPLEEQERSFVPDRAL